MSPSLNHRSECAKDFFDQVLVSKNIECLNHLNFQSPNDIENVLEKTEDKIKQLMG